jgi:hypothetical protein
VRTERPSCIVQRQSGQASAELVAVLPVLLIAALVAAQVIAAGWSLWSAATAARAGARAAAVGADAEEVAGDALPGGLEDGSEVEERDGGEISVSVEVPRLVPGLPVIEVSAGSRLEPEPG